MIPRPASSAAQILSQKLLIRASAGTGKTFQLSSRYIALLRHSSPEKILASTFTRKAAGEILERVLLRLAHAVLNPDSLKVLADSVGPPELTREECLALLSRLTRQLHRVRICTLDSFFSQLAGSYALELGLPPGWRVLDTLEIDKLRNGAIEEMLTAGAPQDLVQLMHLLDKGQSSRSISRLITETISNLYSVFLAAPAESWERFPDYPFLQRPERDELQLLIESVPLDKVSLTKARDQDVEAIRGEDWESLLKRGLTGKILSGEMKFSRVPIPEALRGPYERIAQHVLASVAEPWKSQTLAARQLLRDYHTCFENAKRTAGGLEFGDVTRRLAAAQSQSRLVDSSFRLDTSIDHLLLDEFQDTSPEQWNVIRSFAEEACREPGRTFFCVGDPKQAIYGWRGGEAALFDLITEELPGDSAGALELNLSYRSSPVIMETVNLAMRQMTNHDNLSEHQEILYQWGKRFPEHQTARRNLSGYACVRTLSETNADLPEFGEEIEQPREYWAEVAAYVKARRDEVPGASIGILTRKNPTIGRLIFELSQLGIDASEEGGNPLTDSAAVQLVLSLFRLADHPGHTIAAFHVASSPLGSIQNWTEYQNPFSRMKFSTELRQKLINRGYGGLVHEIVPALLPFCNRREGQRLTQLADLADRYDNLMADLRPGGFVEFIEQQRKEEPSSASVRVMTIHQSKGLEFDLVILPEMDSNLYLSPKYVSHSPAPGAPPDLVALYRSSEQFKFLGGDLLEARQATRDRMFQEALCLLYVAMTRAARSLHLLMLPKVSKNHPKTFAGLVRAALAPQVPVTPNTVLWELGREDWYAGTPLVNGPAVESGKGEEPAARNITFAEPTSRQHWTRQTPTGRRTPATVPLSRELVPTRSLSLAKGTLFHRWMEQIQWLDDASPGQEQLTLIARQCGVLEADGARWMNEFQAMLKSSWCRTLFSRQFYASSASPFSEETRSRLMQKRARVSVRQELPFTVQTGSAELLSGCLDRVVIAEDNGVPLEADVIDFKTDELTSTHDLSSRTEHYQEQMQAYRLAVSQLFRIPPEKVSVRLCFLQSGDIVSIPPTHDID